MHSEKVDATISYFGVVSFNKNKCVHLALHAWRANRQPSLAWPTVSSSSSSHSASATIKYTAPKTL